MEQVIEISAEIQADTPDQEIAELSFDMLDKIGGGVVGVFL
jgi:hypothetical protein